MLMRAGRIVAAGELEAVLTAMNLSGTFGLGLRLERRGDGRFSAWAVR
jgi:iron complex transport system ATP-binding protein